MTRDEAIADLRRQCLDRIRGCTRLIVQYRGRETEPRCQRLMDLRAGLRRAVDELDKGELPATFNLPRLGGGGGD